MLIARNIKANAARRQAADAPWEEAGAKERSPYKPHIRFDTAFPRFISQDADDLEMRETFRRISTARHSPQPQPQLQNESWECLGTLPVYDDFMHQVAQNLYSTRLSSWPSLLPPLSPPSLRPWTLSTHSPLSRHEPDSAHTPRQLPPPREAAPIPVTTLTPSDEARPQPPPQAMEGSGLGMLAPPPTRSSFHNALTFPPDPNADVEVFQHLPHDDLLNEFGDLAAGPGIRLGSPFNASGARNNEEDAGGEQPALATQPTEANNEANPDDDIRLGPIDFSAYAPDPVAANFYNLDTVYHAPADLMNKPKNFWTSDDPEKPDPDNMRGFAQLVFNDGVYIVSSTELVLGRNEEFAKGQKKEKKRKGKLAKQNVNRSRAAEEALNQYRQEPSQHEGEPFSQDDQLLEGRPAKGLASNFSEQGGIIEIKDGEDEARKKRKERKRRSMLISGQSSSTTSVVPANLHTFASVDAEPEDVDDVEASKFLPVHTAEGSDIFKISRQHLRIFYNKASNRWQMEVLGRAAMVAQPSQRPQDGDDEDDMTAGTSQLLCGEVINLESGTRIQVASLAFVFKLPSADPISPFDSDSELSEAENALASPARRLSDVIVDASSDEEDGVPLAQIAKQKKAKKATKEKAESIKKPAKKPAVPLKIKLKPPKPDADPSAGKVSPEETAKAAGKVKKPKKTVTEPEPEKEKADDIVQTIEREAGANEPSVPAADGLTTATTAAPSDAGPLAAPAATPQILPDSALAGIDPDQLPEKRKGPGRPPKNGYVSKRDLGMIRRLEKEYDKQNIPHPPFDHMVAQVRAESKQKEATAKAAQRGETMTTPSITQGIGLAGPSPMPQQFESSDAALISALTSVNNPPIDPAIADSIEERKPGTAGEEMKESPKRQRAYRSPSPMKPREECTEEELKKPSHTYYTTIEMILAEGPPQGLELQQIYDKICKKFPFYKYGQEGHGWQSSVRHNLKQHERFKPTVKQGKGWLWCIDPTVPFDKEKKRRPSPPQQGQRPQMPFPMQNGVPVPPQQGMPGQFAGLPYPPGQYGQPVNGQAPYNQQPPQPGNPQGQYSSPYGQPGQAQTYGPPQPGSGAPSNGQYAYQQQPLPIGQQATYVNANGRPSGAPRTSHTPHPHPGSSTTPCPKTPTPQPPKLKSLVDRIMSYRSDFLAPYARDQESKPYKDHEAIFKKCVDWISELQSNGKPTLDFACDLERKVYQDLEAMMRGEESDGASAEAGAAAQGQDNAMQQTNLQGQQPNAQFKQEPQQSQQLPQPMAGHVQSQQFQPQSQQQMPPQAHQAQQQAGQFQSQQLPLQNQQQVQPQLQRSPGQQNQPLGQMQNQIQQQMPQQMMQSRSPQMLQGQTQAPQQMHQQSVQPGSFQQAQRAQTPQQMQQSMQQRSPQQFQQMQSFPQQVPSPGQHQQLPQGQYQQSSQPPLPGQIMQRSPSQQMPSQAQMQQMQQAQQAGARQQSQGYSPQGQQQYGQMQYGPRQTQSRSPLQGHHQGAPMQRSNSQNQVFAHVASPMPTNTASVNGHAPSRPATPMQAYGNQSRPVSAQGMAQPNRSPSFAAMNGQHMSGLTNPIPPVRSPHFQHAPNGASQYGNPYGPAPNQTAGGAPMSRTPSAGHPVGMPGNIYPPQQQQYHHTPSPRQQPGPPSRPSVSPISRSAQPSPRQMPQQQQSQQPEQQLVPKASATPQQAPPANVQSQITHTPPTVANPSTTVAGTKRAASGEIEGQGSPEKKAKIDE